MTKKQQQAELTRIYTQEKFGCRHDKQLAREALARLFTQESNLTPVEMRKALAAAKKNTPDKCPTCGQQIKA